MAVNNPPAEQMALTLLEKHHQKTVTRPEPCLSGLLSYTENQLCSYRRLLDLLGFPCAQILHWMIRVWTGVKSVSLIKVADWVGKSGDKQKEKAH